MEDTGIVIKDNETNEYYAGLNQWDKQLRKAKIYHSKRYVNDIMNDSRFSKRKLVLIDIIIKEV